MLRLGVNVDHVATVRQARRAAVPDPVHAAYLAESGGADGITVHLRADRRHIQDRDVELLRRTVKTRLNLEMAATDEMLRVALAVRPDQVTLVPERPEELTTEGGLDVLRHHATLRAARVTLEQAGIEVSLFIDPLAEQVRATQALGAVAFEINTAAYSEARGAARGAALDVLAATARLGRELGLHVHAGHGLDYDNVGALAALPELLELNIGHAIVARAVLVGLERAVREMKDALRRARPATGGDAH
jgi:pyridoxine 5-phosphate synthase